MAIDLDQLIARMEWARARNLSELTFTTDGLRITLRREKAELNAPTFTQTASRADPDTTGDDTLNSPLAGVCHLTPEAGGAPFVTPGNTVKAGQTVCVIEAMKVMISVTASQDGTVEAVLIEDGAHVEAGAPLMRIR